MPSGSKAYYKGEGNEFATLDIEVMSIDDDYTIIDEDNGGVRLRKIYRIGEDRIEVLSKQPIDFDEMFPTSEELADLQPIEIYLQKPIEVGATFEKWEILDTGITLETPYKVFHNVIVIQSSDENFINRKYFAKGFGEIKREAIQNSEDNEFTVTSVLEDVTLK